MKITRENLEVVAARFYMNESCLSTEEFLEDLGQHYVIRRLAKKILNKKSNNVRLLTNHIICFTNSFDVGFSKALLIKDDDESEVIRAVFLYLGFLTKYEYNPEQLDFRTVKLLKEMD